MNGIVLARCMDCDSEYFFMDGSRCAACLSALQNVGQAAEDQQPADILAEDAEELRLARAA